VIGGRCQVSSTHERANCAQHLGKLNIVYAKCAQHQGMPSELDNRGCQESLTITIEIEPSQRPDQVSTIINYH